jgi:RNA polymerase sigma factor (sigma-70 family)
MMKPEAMNDGAVESESLQWTLVENLATFRAFAQKRMGDPELAADVVQDALLKALRAETRLEEGDNVVAWFYRILRNTITDLHRRKSVQAKALEKFGHELDAGPDEEARQFICGCIKRLLPALKPEYAEVVRRIDFEEQPTTMVAASLGITPGNLKVRLHRARQQLKERLIETCQLCAAHGCLNCECQPKQEP